MKHNNYLSFVLICWIWMLCGCVGQNVTESQVASYKAGLSFSNTPTLKLYTDKPLLLTVLLINNSSDSITQIAFKSKSANLSILNSECDTLLAGKSCKLNLQLNATINDDGSLLEAYGKDSSGSSYQAKQLFNYTSSLDVEESIQTDKFNNPIISGQGKIYGIAIPFYKNNPNKQVDSSVTGLNNILSQEIVCSSQELSQCTLIITGLSDYSLNGTIKLASNTEVFYTSLVNILAASRGNLLSSNYNVLVSPADGNSYTNITLLNNGSESITEIKMSAINRSGIESQIMVSGCSRVESSNVIFGKSKQPLTIQPMLMFDNTTVNTYVVTNDNGKIYACPTDRITGKLTTCSEIFDLPTIYGLNIYKHAMWDTISNSMKYYLYVGGQNYLGSDNYIGVCPITESGALISNCTLDSSIGADTSNIMFEESSIYEISYNNAKVCKLSPDSGKTIVSSCVSVGGNINSLISSAFINSMVVAVVKDSNNVKSRYAYLSNQGGVNGDTVNGSIIRCTLAKNTTTNNLDFNNCIVVDNITNMVGLRGLEVVSIGDKSYLYYTNNKNVSNGLLSREILQNSSLGNITTQPAIFSPTTSSYVSDQIYTLKLPEAFLQYDKYQYAQSGSGIFSVTMTFTGSGKTGSTRVFFPSLPTGITFNKGTSGKPSLDFAVESGLNTQTINVTVDRSKISSAKTYTIKAKTSNGVVVPDLVIDIK